MSPDDDATPQNQLPSNVVAYNGVVTPYHSEERPLTLSGRQLTINGQPLVLNDSGSPIDENRVILTGLDGTPLTFRDGTVLTGRIPPEDGSSTDDGLPDIPDGQAFIVDADGAFLVDNDGAYLTTDNHDFTTDENGNRIVAGTSNPVRGSLAAFDSSAFTADAFAIHGGATNDNDSDDGIYSIDEPLPDISDLADDEDWSQPDAGEDYTKTALRRTDNPPPGEAFNTDENGRILVDSAGNALALNLAGRSATGSTFSNFRFAEATFGPGNDQVVDSDTGSNGIGDRSVEALHQKMLARMDSLEVLIRQQVQVAPNRGHNHPPGLLEIERPVTQAQWLEATNAIAEIRRESATASPNPSNVVAQASVFQRIARALAIGTIWVVGAVATGIIGDQAADVFKAHQHQIYMALMGAADAALAWAHHLPTLL